MVEMESVYIVNIEVIQYFTMLECQEWEYLISTAQFEQNPSCN